MVPFAGRSRNILEVESHGRKWIPRWGGRHLRHHGPAPLPGLFLLSGIDVLWWAFLSAFCLSQLPTRHSPGTAEGVWTARPPRSDWPYGQVYEELFWLLIDVWGAKLIVGDVIPRQVGLCIRKQAKQEPESKPVSSLPLGFLSWALALTSFKDGRWPGSVRGNNPFSPHVAFVRDFDHRAEKQSSTSFLPVAMPSLPWWTASLWNHMPK